MNVYSYYYSPKDTNRKSHIRPLSTSTVVTQPYKSKFDKSHSHPLHDHSLATLQFFPYTCIKTTTPEYHARPGPPSYLPRNLAHFIIDSEIPNLSFSLDFERRVSSLPQHHRLRRRRRPRDQGPRRPRPQRRALNSSPRRTRPKPAAWPVGKGARPSRRPRRRGNGPRRWPRRPRATSSSRTSARG